MSKPICDELTSKENPNEISKSKNQSNSFIFVISNKKIIFIDFRNIVSIYVHTA